MISYNQVQEKPYKYREYMYIEPNIYQVTVGFPPSQKQEKQTYNIVNSFFFLEKIVKYNNEYLLYNWTLKVAEAAF